ncbi:Splicing factor 3B subunit 5/RDS3 complex subunit 10, partial [Prunus dulcis]
MQASDRFNINSQLEHLQAKYVGTGHADLNRYEWAVNIQRDSYASYVGHYPILAYFALAENEKCFCLVVLPQREKMIDHCRKDSVNDDHALWLYVLDLPTFSLSISYMHRASRGTDKYFK